MQLLLSKMRCGDVDRIYDVSVVLCSKDQQLLKHMAITNENSTPEFKKSSQLEVESN
jgi:hypothetical protein